MLKEAGDLMNKTGEWEWFEDDRPIDLTPYLNMSEEERNVEIERLEAEGRAERDRLEREKALALIFMFQTNTHTCSFGGITHP